MSEEKGNNRLVQIGGALIILAAAGIMLPAIFAYVAGIGRMVILIVVALAAAYLLNMMMARQAIDRMRRAKAAASGNTLVSGGTTYYFCSKECKQKFQSNLAGPRENSASRRQGD